MSDIVGTSQLPPLQESSTVDATQDQVQTQAYTSDIPTAGAPKLNESGKINAGIMNQIINELQDARLRGSTDLPVRDIPRDTAHLTQDPNVQVDYVPQAATRDYIAEQNEYKYPLEQPVEKPQTQLDWLYQEFQVPIRLFVLYFIFQLPIVKETLCHYAPYLARQSGQYNLNGYIAVSLLFSFIYFCWSRAIAKISGGIA